MSAKVASLLVAVGLSMFLAASPLVRPTCCEKRSYCCSVHQLCCPKTVANWNDNVTAEAVPLDRSVPIANVP
jgi:hypothetical protein